MMKPLNIRQPTNAIPVHAGVVIPVVTSRMLDNASNPPNEMSSSFADDSHEETKEQSELEEEQQHQGEAKQEEEEKQVIEKRLLEEKQQHQGEEKQQEEKQITEKKLLEKSKPAVVASKLFHHLPLQLDPSLGLFQKSVISKGFGVSSDEVSKELLQVLPKASSLSSYKDDVVLVFGGIVNIDDNHVDVLSEIILLYLPSENLWLFYGTMPEPRCYHAASLVDNTVYVTGGYFMFQTQHGEMMSSAKTFSFCVKKEIWKPCADMKDARACHAMVAVKQKLYVFGGRGIYGYPLSSVEMFDPTYDMWTTVSVMPQPCMSLSAVFCKDIIWLIGGAASADNIDESHFLSNVLSYDPSSKIWNSQTSLPSGKAYSSAVTFDDNIWLLGGAKLDHDDDEVFKLCSVSEVLCLPADDDIWHPQTNLYFPLHSSTAILGGSKIYCIGGMNSSMNLPCKIINVVNVETSTCTDNHSIPIAVAGSCSMYLPHKQVETLVSLSSSKEMDLCTLPMTVKSVERESLKNSNAHDEISRDLQFQSGNEEIVTCLPTSDAKELKMSDSETSDKNSNAYNNISKDFEFKSGNDEIETCLPTSDAEELKKFDSKTSDKNSNDHSKISKGLQFRFDSEEEVDSKTRTNHHLISKYSNLSPYGRDLKNKHSFHTMDLKQSKCPDERSPSEIKKFVRRYNQPTSPKLFRSVFIIHLRTGFVHKIIQEFDITTVVQKHIVSEKQITSRMMNVEIPVSISSENKPDDEFGVASPVIVDSVLPDVRIATATFPQKEYDAYGFIKTRKKTSFPSVQDIKFTSLESDSGERFYRVVKEVMLIPTEKPMSDIHYYPDFCTLAKMSAKYQNLQLQKEESMQEYVLRLQRAQCTEEYQLPIILVFGGLANNGRGDILLRFNQIKNLWECAGRMPESIMYHSIILLKHIIYITGGFDVNVALQGKVMPTDSVVSYDLKERYWNHKTQMLHSRAYHNTVAFNGNIFVIGGQDQYGMVLSSVEMYDDVRDHWIACQDTPYPVMGAAACIFQDCIHIIGGVTILQGKQQITRNIMVYNPASARWSIEHSLPHAIAYASVTCSSDKLWLFGGLTFDGHSFKSLQNILVFNVQSSEWNIAGKLSIPKHCTSSLIVDSYCYVIGGITSNGNSPVTSTDLFICSEGKTVPLCPLPVTLIGTNALLLPSVYNH